jgi:hypothetical protein
MQARISDFPIHACVLTPAVVALRAPYSGDTTVGGCQHGLGSLNPHLGYGALREDVMAKARRHARELAAAGVSAYEIELRLNKGLTRTEQELLRIVIRSEVAGARRRRIAESVQLGPGWFR